MQEEAVNPQVDRGASGRQSEKMMVYGCKFAR